MNKLCIVIYIHVIVCVYVYVCTNDEGGVGAHAYKYS